MEILFLTISGCTHDGVNTFSYLDDNGKPIFDTDCPKKKMKKCIEEMNDVCDGKLKVVDTDRMYDKTNRITYYCRGR
jgi:hypothetical protein